MADNPQTYAMKGRLTLSRSGWVLLEVPNSIGNGLFQALSEHGVEQPVSETSGRYNAHISVMRPEEVTAVGGPGMIKARGQTFGFNLGAVREITNPGGWDDVSKVWVIEAKSPELMKMRRSLNLSDPKYPFHITFAIRKKNALKVASIIHFRKLAAQTTEIKPSPIEGKGLFATADFQAGDVIVPHFMTKATGADGRTNWDQSEQCRFTNHSGDANCIIVPDDDYVKLVADRDIVKGEELTGDYSSCERVLGDFDFTYHGKPYNGESTTQSSHGRDHAPVTRTILGTLAQDESSDSDSLYAGPETGDHSADISEEVRDTDARSSSNASQDHRAAGEAGPDSDRDKTASVYLRGYAAGNEQKHQHANDEGIISKWLAIKAATTVNRTEQGSDIAGGLLLKMATESVNKNRSAQSRKCPGCGCQFKKDEPYPDVKNCEVCERFGPPALVKEGIALVTQIANARKDTAAPTPAQAAAGNYAKGKVTMHGMQFAIETPKGGTRSGTSRDGKKWSNTMTADYGYILGTEGKDGDHVDVFIGPDPDAEMVFVVDQFDPATDKFDEHKVMFGYTTEEAATKSYLSNYAKGWKGLKYITPMTMRQFRWWLTNGDQHKIVNGLQVKNASTGVVRQLLDRVIAGTIA